MVCIFFVDNCSGLPESSGKFNGALHMLDSVSCFNKEITEQPDWYSITDTDYNGLYRK